MAENITKSDCCMGNLRVSGHEGKSDGTNFYVCKECGKPCSPVNHPETLRNRLMEAKGLILQCARDHGVIDAQAGVTVPPVEFCEDNKTSKLLRDAWLEGWNSVKK